MNNFVIHFLVGNVGISLALALLLLIRRFLSKTLTSRTQYRLWYLFLCLLAVPFFPVRHMPSMGIPLHYLDPAGLSFAEISKNTAAASGKLSGQLYDFAVSVTSRSGPLNVSVLTAVWLSGVTVMLISGLRSFLILRRMKARSVILENGRLLTVYADCREKLHITRNIPVRCTDDISSPVIIGLFRPCIYFPISLLSGCSDSALCHMLLHELQHYRRKDAISNGAVQAARIVYWFNPFVRLALLCMRNDRELACDAAVLDILPPEDYTAYGSTLLALAAKNARTAPAFGSGISQNMRKMTARIRQISDYRKPSRKKKRQSTAIFLATALLYTGLSPAITVCAGYDSVYDWRPSPAQMKEADVSSCFADLSGCFVLYDLQKDNWLVCKKDQAVKRVSPDSTFKIYTALSALEEGLITPRDSQISWDQEIYPFAQWNHDQTLTSAMKASVNWYFDDLLTQLGKSTIRRYARDLQYGNQDISGGFPSFWMESSLKISAVEQVELLVSLYKNDFGYSPDNILAVKDALHIVSAEGVSLYGKTGTGQIDGKDINGWFIGWVEKAEHTCFFAVNLCGEQDATGSRAADIAGNILADLGYMDKSLWEQ